MKLRNRENNLTGKLTHIDFDIDVDEKEIDLTILLDNSDGECIDRQFYSLAELKSFLRDWEEYEPAKPIIKDEKIRKAVRAWAELNNIQSVTYDEIHQDRGLNVYLFEDNEGENAAIQCYGWIPTLEEGESHSITELCGEEEE